MYPSAWAMTVFPPLVFFSHNFFPPLDVIFQGDRFLKVGGGGGGHFRSLYLFVFNSSGLKRHCDLIGLA